MTYKKLMTIISKSLKRKASYIELNKHFMKLFIGIDILISKIRNKRIELSIDAVNYTTQTIQLNSTKINTVIKHHYRKIEDSLQECAGLFINR